MKQHFAMMAGYNAWCNERLYEGAAQLTDADYRADRGAFFKSVHGTLNHILVADRIWMRRFTGEGEAPNRLDTILFESFAELRAAREKEDARIVAYIDRLPKPTHQLFLRAGSRSIPAIRKLRSSRQNINPEEKGNNI